MISLSKIKLKLYKIKRIIINRINFFVYKGVKKYDLIIYDDIYPHPISGFRLEEFTFLLNKFDNSKIVIDPKSYKFLNRSIQNHQKDINFIVKNNPKLKNRISTKKRFLNINAKLFYCVFLNNIYSFLPYLEKHNIPFMFTLYPGGGFKVNDKEINDKLRKVCSSKMFKGVFTTQKFTSEYLLKNNFCLKEEVYLIFGCVVPQISLKRELKFREYYSYEKKVFNICFCAIKYSTYGEDKGYDIFINVVRQLVKENKFIKIHVIGGFDKDTIPIDDLKNNIEFYGYLKFDELSAIFQNMDIIVSPNRSFKLNDGEFDGFPLGTVVEAVLNGVVALLSDELNQNTDFVDFKDLIIVKNEEIDIINKINYLIGNPNELKKISISGRKKFQEIYSNSSQMKPRFEKLNKIIFNEKN